VTVGEKIGKQHLTYDRAPRPNCRHGYDRRCRHVWAARSTTHVLSSGVAGTMAANGSGVQMGTIRNLLMAWVLTLPCAIMLSATLYLCFGILCKSEGFVWKHD